MAGAASQLSDSPQTPAWRIVGRDVFAAVGRTLRRPPRWLILTLLLLAIELSYVYIISAGTFVRWQTWNGNYNLQAEGFRAGHLYLPIEPPAELRAAKNPFDPAYRNYWFWDASFANGHYYLYWGPVPALVIAAFKSAFGIKGEIGDQYPTFIFYTIHLVAGALLIERMARRLFERVPLWLVILSILVFAYGNPTPFMIATPGIYEAAIVGGQSLLLLGMLFVFDGLWRRRAGRSGRTFFLLAGVAWALGLGTRVSIGPSACLIALFGLLLGMSGRSTRSWLERVRAGALMAVPVGATAVGLLAYNKARFGGLLDFGMARQMSTMQFRTSSEYVLPNLYNYLLRPLQLSCRFPFVSVLPSERGFPSWLTFPKGYWNPEPLVGMLTATPWSWLMPVALFFAGRAAWSLWRDRMRLDDSDMLSRLSMWCALSFIVLATVTGLPTAAQFIATMRYVADVSSGIILLASWGAWSLYVAVKDHPWGRRGVVFGLVGLGVLTIVLGGLLGLQGYDLMFQRHNPALFHRWVAAFSRC